MIGFVPDMRKASLTIHAIGIPEKIRAIPKECLWDVQFMS
jgi:hypothetical protein